MSDKEMKIAVACADTQGLDGHVSQHFGRCSTYTLVSVADGGIQNSSVEENPFTSGHGPGQIPGFIASLGAQVIITGGIGQMAVGFFEQHGISVASGFQGTVREAVEGYLRGEGNNADPCPGGHGDCTD